MGGYARQRRIIDSDLAPALDVTEYGKAGYSTDMAGTAAYAVQ